MLQEPLEKKPIEHKTGKKLGEGRYFPLGATLEEDGVNFAIYSKHAQEVYLLLFDEPHGEPTDVIKLKNTTKFIWYTFVHGLKAGQLYGYKIKGPYDPRNGFRFNENKLLIDPYARALTGKTVNTGNILMGYDPSSEAKDLSFDERDSTEVMPKCVVVDDRFDWRGDKPLNIPMERSIIYEVHLKGFTAHPSSKVGNPGTYLGFIEKIPYLKELGITAVELMPVQEFYKEDFLVKQGLANYWGYNTVGFFAPESSYAAGRALAAQVTEFKTLVRALHEAGIEVIMDVVYNHTGEGNELGPTVCFRGIDNLTYYSLKGSPEAPQRYYENFSGCGNCLNVADPYTVRLIVDSLRYWVEVMHVDGFRFDLAAILGRDEGVFKDKSSFFNVITQDPLLNRVKLIAEPWDLGTYQVGKFPVDWSEWNGRFRDTVRKFGKGDSGQLWEMKSRLSGSPDLYGEDGRTIYNSINFVTCHDGFTLKDLVSFNQKHNEANLENNRDGTDYNNSWNCGAEGDTADAAVVKLRKRLAKNFMCYLFFSSGTPMILGGDEFLRSQKGNNNAYCQDNELTWFNWELVEKNRDFLVFCRDLIRIVNKYKAFQMRKYAPEYLSPEVELFRHKWYGKSLDEPAWGDPDQRTLALYMYTEEKNQERYDIFIIYNADWREQSVKLPPLGPGRKWCRKIDTSLDAGKDFLEIGEEVAVDPPDRYIANPRSTVLLMGRA